MNSAFYLTIRLITFDLYLNNTCRVLLSSNYRLIAAPLKFDVLKINTCLRSEKNVLTIENKYANYQTDSSETQKLDCSPLNFLPHASSEMILNYFH